MVLFGNASTPTLPPGSAEEVIAYTRRCLTVIGANLYREFALLYNDELSEEFGGIF